jgi:hypothetical protein
MNSFSSEVTLSIKGCHASCAGRRYGLAIGFIGSITGYKNAFDVCFG